MHNTLPLDELYCPVIELLEVVRREGDLVRLVAWRGSLSINIRHQAAK